MLGTSGASLGKFFKVINASGAGSAFTIDQTGTGKLLELKDSGTDVFSVSDGGTISTGTWQGTAIARTYIGADVIDDTKIDDNAINSEHITAGAVDDSHLSGGIANGKLTGPAISVTDGSTSSNIAPGGAVRVDGTSLQVAVTQSGGTFTVGLPDDVTISGDLTVSGSRVQADVATLSIEDSLFDLARNNTTNAVDIGFYGKYQPVSTALYTGFFWDAGASKYRLFHGLETVPTSTVDITGTGYAISTLVTNIEGNASGTSGSTTGNAATATALATSRNFTVAGDVVTASPIGFDGTGVVALTVAFNGAVIVDADINASAAIAFSKMANLTANKVLLSDGSGDVSASSVTNTTLGYLDASSSIQDQLDAITGGATSLIGLTATNTTDSTHFPVFVDTATGNENPRTDSGFTYNPSSGTLTSTNFAGVASSATILATTRAINGVNFDGSGPITITAAGSTLSDTVPVTKGGTGLTSLTDKAVLITQDSSTDAFTATAMSTNGQLLIGGTSGPAVATLTEGANITITPGDGTIQIASSGASVPTEVALAATNSTDATHYPMFSSAATGDEEPRTDTGLTYNPSSGTLTSTIFAGNATGLTATLAVAAGGTGSTGASAARTALGVAIGSNVQAHDADLDTIAGLAKTANNFIMATGSAWALTTPADARTGLGLVIGTNVQAYDAGLASIAGLTTATDKMIYTSGADTYAVADLSSFARTILDDADAAAARTTLGLAALATLATVNNDQWSGTDLAVANGGTGASTATGGFDALSPMTTSGDTVYGGTSGTVTRLAKGDDDDVLTLASGVPSWAAPAVSGDSSASIVVATGKTVTAGEPVVLNSDGLAEPVDHGRGTQGNVVSFTTTTADGKGSQFVCFDIEDSRYNQPWQHVYDPNAEAHVFFFWLKNANHATDSLATNTYNAVAWVTKWDSGTDAWITGPQQTFPDSSDGIDYSQAASDKHSSLEAYYHSLDNTIGVVWVNQDDDNLQFTQCKVTGAGASIGLEWAQSVEVDSATEKLINFCPAGGTGTTPRWVFYYESTSADSGDLVLRMGVSNTFSTSSDALGTIGSEYNIFTGTIDASHAGYKQHGITYNRSTGSLLIGNSPYYYGGMFKLLYAGDLETSTSVSSPYGASITSWFYFLNTYGDASNTTAYLSVPNFVALKEDYVDGDYKEKWMAFGPDYSGQTWKMFMFTIDTTTTSGNDPFRYMEAVDSLGATYQDMMYYNVATVSTGYFRFQHSHFRLNDPVMGNDHRYVTEVGGAAGAADGMAEFFTIHFTYGLNSSSQSYWMAFGWNDEYTDIDGLALGMPRGVTNNTDFTDINKAPIRGYSPQQLTGSYHSRLYEAYYPVGSNTWLTNSSWVYDPDAEKWFLFYTGPIANDTLKSWDFGLLYRQLDMPASIFTTSETQPNVGSNNGTYIGLANSTVIGNGSNTVTVLIPGSVATGLADLIPGVVYFTDDTGQIHPRAPSMSMDINKRIGTALTTTSIKVEDLIEDTLHAEYFPYPSTTTGEFLYTVS